MIRPVGAETRLLVYAATDTAGAPDFDGPDLREAVMLVRSDPPQELGAGEPAGLACRICPRRGCPARREPSILPGLDEDSAALTA